MIPNTAAEVPAVTGVPFLCQRFYTSALDSNEISHIHLFSEIKIYSELPTLGFL